MGDERMEKRTGVEIAPNLKCREHTVFPLHVWTRLGLIFDVRTAGVVVKFCAVAGRFALFVIAAVVCGD